MSNLQRKSLEYSHTVHFLGEMKPKIKIKPLNSIQQALVWLCIHPPDATSMAEQKKKYKRCAKAFLISYLSIILGCSFFCSEYITTDFDKCVFAFMSAAAVFGVMYMLIVGILVIRPKISAIFNDLSSIYENRKC